MLHFMMSKLCYMFYIGFMELYRETHIKQSQVVTSRTRIYLLQELIIYQLNRSKKQYH